MVDRAAPVELGVGADAGHLAVVENDDLVGVPDGRHTLRDDEHSHVLGVGLNRLSERGIRREIERGRGVVEDQDLRATHERTRDRESLLLSAGEVPALLLDLELEALALLLHEIVGLGGLQRGVNLRIRRVRLAPLHVRAERAAEQHGALRHEADLFTKRLKRIVPDILSCNEHLPRRHIVEAWNQVDEGRLAGTGAADHADGLTRHRTEADVAECILGPLGVGKCSLPELNLRDAAVLVTTTLQSCRCCGSRRRSDCVAGGSIGVGHRRLQREDAVDAVHAGHGAGDLDDQVRELDELDENLRHVVHERDEAALGERALIDEAAATIDEVDDSEVDDDVGHRIQQRGDAADADLHLGELLVLTTELVDLRGLAVEGADHADAEQVLTGRLHDAVELALVRAVHRRGRQDDPEHDDEEDHDGHREDEAGAGTDREGHDHGAEHDERRAHEETKCHVDAALDGIDVGGHARDQRAGAERIDLTIAERVDVPEQVVPQALSGMDRDLRGEKLRGEGAQEADRGEREQQAAHAEDIAEVAASDAAVDHARDDERHEKVEAGLEALEQRRQDGAHPVVPDISQ